MRFPLDKIFKAHTNFCDSLIMFLIQSDMFKALWFMIYPIVVFTRGPVADSSTFCKVNGFFIALGVEASGMVAIHVIISVLTLHRLRRPNDCNTQRPLHFQTANHIWRGRTLPIPACCLCSVDHSALTLGFFGLHKLSTLVRYADNILLPPHTTILVSSCVELDSSVYNLCCYSCHICLHIPLCTI